MTNNQANREYQIGTAVLVNFNGAEVPGVIQDTREGKFNVRLAEPWADESGNKNDQVWVGPERLSPAINEETGSQQALPRQS